MNYTLVSLEFNKIKKDIKRFCLSKIGEEEIDNISFLPTKDDLFVALETLDCFVKHISQFQFPSFDLPDIRGVLLKIEKDGVVFPEELLGVRNFIISVNRIKNYFLSSSFEIIKNIVSDFPDFSNILVRINQIIDNNGGIKDEASLELTEIRNKMRKIKENINLILKKILDDPNYIPFLQDRFVSFKSDRWVIPVKSSYKHQIKGFIIDTSNSGETVFIEPDVIVTKNNEYRESLLEEKKEIQRILKKISNTIKNRMNDFKRSIEILKVIELNSSKALYAINNKHKKPVISNYWDMIKVRHPFIENPIPIDIFLGKDFDILIITGPNTGGKTAALKTIGLLTIMANSGLFIPAEEGSVVSWVDSVFIDIGDEQSLSQNLSTFSSHIRRINTILKKATPNSLVLIDEIGAGTDPKDGASLGVAIIEYLIDKKIRAVITSHFEKVKNVAFFKERVENATVDFDPKTLTPRYKLIIGITGKSMGIEIARRLNLPESIIKRAMEISMPTNKDYELNNVLDKLNEEIRNYENKRKYYENLLTSLVKKEEELARREKEINMLVEKLKYKEKIETFEFLKEKRKYILNKLKEVESDNKESLKEVLKDIDSFYKDLKEKESEKENESKEKQINIEASVTIGDKVIVDGIGECEVVDISKNFITVKAGVIKIKIEKKDIIGIKGKVKEDIRVNFNAPLKDIFELNIIGKNRDEAIREIEAYVESLIIKGGGEGIIIHGKGKGILKESVIEVLKKYNIKKYIHSPDGGATKFIVE